MTFKKGCTPWNKGIKSEILSRAKKLDWEKGVYDNRPNNGPFQKGHTINSNVSPKTREKISSTLKGRKCPWVAKHNRNRPEQEHPRWKGNDVGYVSLHQWIRKHLGVPCRCEVCETTDKRKKYEWHNVDGLYERTLEGWQRVCRKCHYQLDYGERRVRTF